MHLRTLKKTGRKIPYKYSESVVCFIFFFVIKPVYTTDNTKKPCCALLSSFVLWDFSLLLNPIVVPIKLNALVNSEVSVKVKVLAVEMPYVAKAQLLFVASILREEDQCVRPVKNAKKLRFLSCLGLTSTTIAPDFMTTHDLLAKTVVSKT